MSDGAVEVIIFAGAGAIILTVTIIAWIVFSWIERQIRGTDYWKSWH